MFSFSQGIWKKTRRHSRLIESLQLKVLTFLVLFLSTLLNQISFLSQLAIIMSFISGQEQRCPRSDVDTSAPMSRGAWQGAGSTRSWHRVPTTINTILICDWNCNILHFSISSAINTLHRRMQAMNTYLKFKWPHWQEILDKSDVSHMLVVPKCEDYWDWDQSIARPSQCHIPDHCDPELRTCGHHL